MSDNNRGAYTPQSEAPLAFDARRSRGPGERPKSGALLISAIVLVVMVIAFGLFAVTRMNSHGGDAPTTIVDMKAADGAPATPAAAPSLTVDAPPAAAPQPAVAAATPANGQPNFTAPPEQPQARPAPGASPPAPPAAAPAPAPAAAIAPPVVKPSAADAKPAIDAKPVIAAKPDAAPAKPVAAPAKPAPAKPLTVAKNDAAPAKPAAAGNATVQIGAFASAAQADREWNDIALGIPAEMAGKTRQVEPIQVGGETRYRALIGGFANHAEAVAVCNRRKARGRDCFAPN